MMFESARRVRFASECEAGSVAQPEPAFFNYLIRLILVIRIRIDYRSHPGRVVTCECSQGYRIGGRL